MMYEIEYSQQTKEDIDNLAYWKKKKQYIFIV